MEGLTQVLLNLIKDLTSNIRVESQQLPSQALVPILIDNIIDLYELVIRVAPSLVALQINELLKNEGVLESTDCFVCVRKSEGQEEVEQRYAVALKRRDQGLVD